MTTTQGWERDFDEKSGESVSEQGFVDDFAGCDDPCCGGCTVRLNGEEIKAFIRAEKKKSYEEGMAAESKLYQPLPIEGMFPHEGKLFAVVQCPERTAGFFFKEVTLTPTDDITPKDNI